eukprot:2692053-Pleurochrysis_carterae.AAC.2
MHPQLLSRTSKQLRIHAHFLTTRMQLINHRILRPRRALRNQGEATLCPRKPAHAPFESLRETARGPRGQ